MKKAASHFDTAFNKGKPISVGSHDLPLKFVRFGLMNAQSEPRYYSVVMGRQ